MVRPPARSNHVVPSWTCSTVVNSLSPFILQFIPRLILLFPDPFVHLSATPPRRKSLSSRLPSSELRKAPVLNISDTIVLLHVLHVPAHQVPLFV